MTSLTLEENIMYFNIVLISVVTLNKKLINVY